MIEGKYVLVLERDGWEYVERKRGKEAVVIIASTDDEKLILVEQYRRPVDANVIEWPAGLIGDDGENDPAATAKKELEEETGYRCERVELMAKGPSSSGITSEIVHFYRAYGLTKVSKGGGIGEEKITVFLVDRENVREWLRARERDGAVIDTKVWGGLYFLGPSLPLRMA